MRRPAENDLIFYHPNLNYITMTVVFDWDGTITDIIPGTFEVVKTLCRLHGRRSISTFEEMRAALDTQTPAELINSLLPDAHDANDRRTKEEIEEVLIRYRVPRDAPVFYDAIPSIRKLHSEGFKLALVSSACRERLLRELERTKIAPYFDMICMETDRPKEENMRQVLAELHQQSHSKAGFWTIGDSNTDIEAARKIEGALPIAVSRGVCTFERLSALAPCYKTVWEAVEDIVTFAKNGVH